MTVIANSQYSFALCLTHDVDKPFKTPFHAAFYTVAEQDPRHLRALSPRTNPYWQFEDIMELEDELGVRSAFYFLNAQSVFSQPLNEIPSVDSIAQLFGRYDVREPPISGVIKRLADGGWEVGLHGSYHTARDRERLLEEKQRIEEVLGHKITGGRQHYLNLAAPETWQHHRAIGLDYDASLGSSTEYGFQFGYDVKRPFDDEFVVFPLTLMDQQLPDPEENFSAAWSVCESLFKTATEEDAVMTVLFHPRLFSERDFPGYRRLYRRIVQRAIDSGAWVGSPGEFYENFLEGSTSDVTTESTSDVTT